MSATRAAMIAGAGAILVGALSTPARADLHRFAFRGQLGEIPEPLLGSPDWSGIAPGDPMLISCVLDAQGELVSLPDLDTAKLISVSLVIGGRFESCDGAESTIRASLEEGIARAGAAGMHNQVVFDLVLPSGVRVFVHQAISAGIADWAIGDTTGQLRATTGAREPAILPPLDPRARTAVVSIDTPATSSPSPGGIALFIPGLAYAARRRRCHKSLQSEDRVL
ncbi:MAG: hypothetical protein KDA20_10535 [Phycisphaerales bacterium]|nr:hypothetical protein [Phycisphaerales bacterium]